MREAETLGLDIIYLCKEHTAFITMRGDRLYCMYGGEEIVSEDQMRVAVGTVINYDELDGKARGL